LSAVLPAWLRAPNPATRHIGQYQAGYCRLISSSPLTHNPKELTMAAKKKAKKKAAKKKK